MFSVCVFGKSGAVASLFKKRIALTVIPPVARLVQTHLMAPLTKNTAASKCLDTRGGRPLGSGHQLPPQLTVGQRPLWGRGGVQGGANGGV